MTGLLRIVDASGEREAELSRGRMTLGITLVSLAFLVSASSYARWERNERAIRMNQALPRSSVPRVLALGLSLVAVGTVLLVLHGAAHLS